ncbi:MAG: ATP-binding protein [Phormidesmis sp.]
MTKPDSLFPGAIPAAVPVNEAERIQKLLSYRVLDTLPETAYDDITQLAAYICDTPTSLVSLIDVSRQWFKSTVGLDMKETSRELAFCAHAILQPNALVVPDAQADARFANNPLVTGAPHIRFYAGAPLITAEGYAVGTLCVIDYKPKQLTAKQVQALEALARQVVGQLEMRLALQHTESEMVKKEDVLQKLRFAQSQLVQNEKMAGLGQLAAGIAHEINNPVSFIAGNISPAQQYANDLIELVTLYKTEYTMPSDVIQTHAEAVDFEFLADDFSRLLKSMETGAQRIANIVTSLKTFSHLEESDKKPTNLQAGLESVLMLLQYRLNVQANRPKIEVVRRFSPLPPIMCCASSLNQVFMNILVNAIDALEDSYRIQQKYQSIQTLARTVDGQIVDTWCDRASAWSPKITITTERFDECFDSHAVMITIADNGPGIHPAVQNKIFDPFVTTKPVGKGTGLGLSISHTIVTEQHQGCLECFSDPDQGTQFIITIPSTDNAKRSAVD